MKNNVARFFFLSVLSISLLTQCAEVGWSGIARMYDNLVHGTGPTATLDLYNTDPATSVFVTSDQGQGLQLEITPTHIFPHFRVGPKSSSYLECQKPVGNPTTCVSYCGNNKSCVAPVLKATYNPTTPEYNTDATQDYLNEIGTFGPIPYVFLDSLINNTDTIYEMAITTAPLYALDSSSSTGGSLPGTLANALDNGTITFRNNIYPLNQQTNPTLQIGSQSYPITFLASGQNALVDGPVNPDGRFTLYGNSSHNILQNKLRIKRHMALYPQSTNLYPSLAIGSTVSTSTYQTIILYPRGVDYGCSPVIYIGRDSVTNAFYALTYLLSSPKTFGGIQCCIQSEAGTPCSNDTLYCPASQQGTSGCNLISTNENGAIQQSPGRLKVVIDPMPDAPQYGWASTIESLPGLWWPGQPDFPEKPSAPVTISEIGAPRFVPAQKSFVALSKTTAIPPKKAKK